MREAAEVTALVRRAQSGDPSAFDALVREHFTPVYSLLHRLVGNPEDAEDLAQETFVRAHKALALYRTDASFSTWLLRIAHHLAIDHRRAQGRPHRAASFSGLEPALVEALVERGPRPGDAAQENELVRRLADALDRLPPKLKAVLVLRVVEEREYDEVAAILGVKAATARTQVMQARKLLVRWLAPWLDEAPDEAAERGDALRDEDGEA
ncbi:MAG: sigma-70 family RNA polymerase sigma factor [Planctomycetes bacterium]|nr:sigma-70 family RNA polymerase sigma factor [Planctomycetota bacterium]